jgi:hypothetical protein
VDEIRSDNRTTDDLPLPVVRFLRSLLDPEGLGWAVNAEVRKEAIKLLGEKSGIKDRYE